MHKIKESVGTVVAGDTQASIAALDAAVIMQSRMCSTVMEAATETGLPMGTTQRVLKTLVSGMNGLVASRGDMVSAVRELSHIQANSNLKTVSYGCPDGFKRRVKTRATANAD